MRQREIEREVVLKLVCSWTDTSFFTLLGNFVTRRILFYMIGFAKVMGRGNIQRKLSVSQMPNAIIAESGEAGKIMANGFS